MVALFLIALLSAGAPPDLQSEGLKALEHQSFKDAKEIFGKLIVAEPGDYSAFFNLGLAETALHEDHLAIEHYSRALQLKPGLYEAQLNLALIYLRNQRPADAAPLLREACNQKRDQIRPRRYLGDSLLATGDFAGAGDAFKQALALDGNSATAELGLGQSLQHQGKLDVAAAHYKRAAELDPQLRSYLLELAAAFSHASRPDDAIPLLQQFPSDPGAREELGRLYLKNDMAPSAVEQFRVAVELSPTPANQLALASAYLMNNQQDLAAPILEKALASNPNDFELHMVVGRLHRDRHDYAAAATEFSVAAKIDPSAVQAWKEMAGASALSGEDQQALTALDQLRKLNQEGKGELYLRAIVLDKLHQVKPALASYRRFLAMSNGEYPDEEFKARQRSRILEKEASR